MYGAIPLVKDFYYTRKVFSNMARRLMRIIGGEFPQDVQSLLRSRGIEFSVNPLGKYPTEDELIAALKDVDAVLAGGSQPFTNRVIVALPRLKIIAIQGVGHENIDLTAATERGVYVTWAPLPELAMGVAEEAFSLILCLLKRICHLDRLMRQGLYNTETPARVEDAYSLTLGIIGLGRIGLEVAKRAKAFRMDVQYCDIIRRREAEEELDIKYLGLEELLQTSDVVTIHAPLTPETEGLIGERELGLMKREALLINTARGAIVDEKALFKALDEGRLGGAGLSVFSREPPPPDHPFHRLGDRLPNVVLMPHIGAGRTTRKVVIDVIINDLIAALQGRTPKHILNKGILGQR